MNYMTRAVEMALAIEHVPYKLVSGTSFFEAKETKLMFGYLRVAAKRASSDDVTSATLFPSRGISKMTCDAVAARGSVDGDWLPSAQAEAPRQNPNQQDKLRQWCGMIDALRRQLVRDHPPSQMLSFVREATGFDTWAKKNVDQDDDSASAQTLEEVFAFCKRYDTVAALLDLVDGVERHRNAYQRQKNCVTVVTVHKSKGSEHPIVYLPQLAHGRFPSRRGDIAEERRLFYVATTRAMNELWISRPLSANRTIVREATNEFDRLMANKQGLVEDDDHIDSIFLTELDIKPAPTFRPGKVIDAVPTGSQLSLI
jgi:DNA helicase-2/ATP-dependent DNA helicase PcrA